MARVAIAEFGTINKGLALAEVAFYVANENGTNTGVLATLYQAETGAGLRSNPQVLTADGQLSVDCFVEVPIVAAIRNISPLVQRALRRITVDPLDYPLPWTSAAVAGSEATVEASNAAVAAAAAAQEAADDAAAALAASAAILAAATGQNLLTGTSTTSLSVTGLGNKTLTTQADKGWTIGQPIRISSDDRSKINDGTVVSYSGTTLVIGVTRTAGSGTHNDWNISVTGEKGANGSGSGDMLGENNLSDVDDPAASRTNLGLGASATKNSYFVQEKTGTLATVLTTTSIIPNDDTIPQNTEGVEVATVTITPTDPLSKLIITGSVSASHSTGGHGGCLALFKNTDLSAIAAAPFPLADNAVMVTGNILHEMEAGGITPITFRLRAGSDAAGTLTINGVGGAQRYGGVVKSIINVIEVKQ